MKRERVDELQELDARIKRLEAELFKSEENSSSSSSNSSSADEEQAMLKDEELEKARIPPLPSHLLPAVGMSKHLRESSRMPKSRKRPRQSEEDEDKVFECDCCAGFSCRGKLKWKKHLRSLLHQQNSVLALGEDFKEPSQGRPMFCRFCKLEFQSLEEKLKHCEAESHKELVEKERKASFCKVCKKQFTSPLQLREHIRGKTHQQILESKKAKWASK